MLYSTDAVHGVHDIEVAVRFWFRFPVDLFYKCLTFCCLFWLLVSWKALCSKVIKLRTVITLLTMYKCLVHIDGSLFHKICICAGSVAVDARVALLASVVTVVWVESSAGCLAYCFYQFARQRPLLTDVPWSSISFTWSLTTSAVRAH